MLVNPYIVGASGGGSQGGGGGGGSTLTEGLIYRYPFNGNIADAVGSNHLTANWFTPAYVTGKLNNALRVSPNGHMASGVVANPDPCTFGGWFRGNWSAIVSGAKIIATLPALVFSSDGADIRLSVNGNLVSAKHTRASESEWCQMLAISENQYTKFYVNGSLLGAVTAQLTASTGPMNFYGGATNDSGYNADFDEWAVWNRALSHAEVGELWNGGAGLELTP